MGFYGHRTKKELNVLISRQLINAAGGQSLLDMGIVINNSVAKISILNIGTTDCWVDNDACDESGYMLMAYTGITMEVTPQGARALRFFVRAGNTTILNVHQEGGWGD